MPAWELKWLEEYTEVWSYFMLSKSLIEASDMSRWTKGLRQTWCHLSGTLTLVDAEACESQSLVCQLKRTVHI